MNERLWGCVWCLLRFENWTQFARVLVVELEILKATICRLTEHAAVRSSRQRFTCSIRIDVQLHANWWRRTDHSHGQKDVIVLSQQNVLSWCTGASYCCCRRFICFMYAVCEKLFRKCSSDNRRGSQSRGSNYRADKSGQQLMDTNPDRRTPNTRHHRKVINGVNSSSLYFAFCSCRLFYVVFNIFCHVYLRGEINVCM